MSIYQGLVEQLRAYVKGATTLAALDHWVTAHTWNVSQLDESGLDHLVGAVELAIAEYTSGHLNETELREFFDASTGHVV